MFVHLVRSPLSPAAALGLSVVALLLLSCQTSPEVVERGPVERESAGSGVAKTADPPATAKHAANPLVSVAGDIACGTNVPEYNNGDGTATQCRQKYTAKLILRSDAVWTLGDHAYPSASTTQLYSAYEPTWGRMKAVTYPTPGDHDFHDGSMDDYLSYFDKPLYYTFQMGGWQVISLNSELDHAPGSAQVQWLQRKLASTNADCIAAFWGTPRWTSGFNEAPGDGAVDAFVQELYAAHADLMLSGDTHNYERFAKQTPAGDPAADGIRQFVVGTGGRSLVGFPGAVQPNSQARHKAFGVLQLRLHPASYDWQFVSETGDNLDSGSQHCN